MSVRSGPSYSAGSDGRPQRINGHKIRELEAKRVLPWVYPLTSSVLKNKRTAMKGSLVELRWNLLDFVSVWDWRTARVHLAATASHR